MDDYFDNDPASYSDPLVVDDPFLTDDPELESPLEAGLDLLPPDEADVDQDGDTGSDEVGVATGEDDVAEMPSELLFGSLNGPDGTTNDSFKEPYDYNHGTGTTLSESGREIDPWTGTEKT